jgi:hypothetical protein
MGAFSSADRGNPQGQNPAPSKGPAVVPQGISRWQEWARLRQELLQLIVRHEHQRRFESSALARV